MILQIPVERIPAVWDRLLTAIRPAIELGKRDTSWGVLMALMEARMTAWVVEDGEALGFVVTRIDWLAGSRPKRRAMWIYYAGGERGSREVHRRALDEFEGIARAASCREFRFSGRCGWGRLFPDYRPIPATTTHEFRKALT